jgi:hypothetical protein
MCGLACQVHNGYRVNSGEDQVFSTPSELPVMFQRSRNAAVVAAAAVQLKKPQATQRQTTVRPASNKNRGFINLNTSQQQINRKMAAHKNGCSAALHCAKPLPKDLLHPCCNKLTPFTIQHCCNAAAASTNQHFYRLSTAGYSPQHIPGYKRVYPKVSGLSRLRNKEQQTLVEKQHKGLWRQNSLERLTK